MYDIWDVLKPLENFINFESVEQRILTFQKLVNQGFVNDKVMEAVKNNDISISAFFSINENQHKLIIKGLNINDIEKYDEKKLAIIKAKDIIIDDISYTDNENKILGIIL